MEGPLLGFLIVVGVIVMICLILGFFAFVFCMMSVAYDYKFGDKSPDEVDNFIENMGKL